MFHTPNFFKGQLKQLILESLHKKPMHGYMLMQGIGTQCMNIWKPTPGALYPALKELKKEGLIEIKSIELKGRKKKVYMLTEKGKKIAAELKSHKADMEKSFSQVFAKEKNTDYTCEDFVFLFKIFKEILGKPVSKYKTTILEFAFLAKNGKISEKQKNKFKRLLLEFLKKTQGINNAQKKI